MLGPLEIRRDGAPLRLRASKQRTFLAVLLVNHGRVVSVDRLIEDVWPESPPAGARHALETHASRLRNLLGEELALVARPPGYVLDVDPQSIDSVRFEQLLEEARASEPARAAVRAADALALWRGDALADFAFESFAQEEIARLEELRQEAEEERIEAELALGRAGELIGELEALVAAAPLRERRRAQLMLALYRSGRQAEALAAFREARKLLLEELGLEPSQALRDLERAILQQDPALAGGTTHRTEAPASRRLVSVVAVEPNISLDLDPEDHERATRAAAETVARIATEHHAQLPEPFVLAFTHEDHGARALAAATALHDALDARVGVESAEAVLSEGSVGGPVVARARERARDAEASPAPTTVPVLERRVNGPFVGRTGELARLHETRAAVVTGPPGIGKSRLARELAHEQRVVVGRCSAYGSDSLAPLREVAAELGAPEALDDAWAAEIPLTFRRLCESANDPLLVVFDDVHWADALVLETIEQLVSQNNGKVRVICLAREELLEERPAFLPGAERLLLEPLALEDAQSLAEQLGAADGSVVERAEGNPLFIEQLLAYATDGAEQLPSTLQALLAARLDRLTPTERLAIERAAVIGREFDAALVADLLDARTARQPLAALVRRGLLDPAPPSAAFEERFRFRHVLIHEAAYAGTSKAERARLHESVADLLDARDAGDEIVGFHLERAAELRPERDRRAQRLAEDAGRRLGAAGMRAFKLGYVTHAAELLQRSVTLLPSEDEQRRELLCELGIALNSAGDTTRADEILTEAATVARRANDRRIELRAGIESAAAHLLDESSSSAHRLLELATESVPIFESLRDDRSLGRTWLLTGWVQGGVVGRWAESRQSAERALEYYRRAGMPSSTCISQIAAAAYYGPMPVGEAIDHLKHLLEDEVDDRAGEASVLAHTGGLESMRGNFDEAADLLKRARAMYEELGRPTAIARTCAPLEAEAARLRGDLEHAERVLRESCTALRQTRNWNHFGSQAAALADVLHELGQAKDAGEWVDAAATKALDDDAAAQIAWRTVRAKIDRDPDLARDAVARAEATDLLNLRAAALLALGDEVSTAEARRLYELKGNVAAASRATAATPPAGRI